MLHQAVHWMEIASTVTDAALVFRVLTLRLYRVYLFITLACVLTVFYDCVNLWLRSDSALSLQVFLYSRFLYVVVYPLVAWDVFEEVKGELGNLRRLATIRLLSALFLIAILALVADASADESDVGGSAATTATAVICWVGGCAASLAFLITMHRVLRSKPSIRLNNTQVWMNFFELILIGELLVCFVMLTDPQMSEMSRSIINIGFMLFGMVITCWCVWKLKRPSADLTSARQRA